MVGLGAIGGVLSALFSQGFKAFNKHKDREYELKLLDRQLAVGKQETERETAVAAIQGQVDALINSRQHDMALTSSSTWVQDLRASLRPLVTYYALAVATVFYFTGSDEIKISIVASFMLLMEAIISFWFTDRVLNKFNG